MNDKKLRLLEVSALGVSAAITFWAMLRAAAWEIDAGGILFFVWAVSPYVCLFLADIVLRKIASVPKMPFVFFVISILMLGFTLLTYVGTMDDKSSTYALIFLFVPVYLFIGSFVLLGIGLAVALFSKRSDSPD